MHLIGNLSAAGRWVGLALALVSTGCVQPRDSYLQSQRIPAPPSQSTATQAQTIGVENRDRIARLQRLAALQGIIPPEIEQVYAPPGSVAGVNQPVPVVRIVFDERVFSISTVTFRARTFRRRST
jgi:hypothetical protein